MTKIFQRFINRQNSQIPSPNPDQREETSSQEISANPGRTVTTNQWKIGFAQSVGLHREHNEDALFVTTFNLAHYDKNNSLGLYIVADGMGGHLSGEVASGTAIKTMSSQVMNKLLAQAFELNDVTLNSAEILSLLNESLLAANETVKNNVPGGGTTLTSALVISSMLYIAHVGDSRIYQITRENRSDILTRDHSFVRQLIDMGQISPEEAAVHPHRNVLSMALGQIEPIDPQIIKHEIIKSSHILICSDGLWGVVPEEQLISIINSEDDPQSACLRLVDLANEAGGPDNITAILLHFPQNSSE